VALFVVSLLAIPSTLAADDTMSAREIMQRKDVGVAVILVTDPRPEQESRSVAANAQTVDVSQFLLTCQPKIER
jgi:hypothetical protein